MKDSLWSPGSPVADSYVLFRGHFRVASPGPVEFRVVGSSWYQAWLDGQPLLEGPLRFASERPEYQSVSLELPAGDHVLAFHAHHLGVETRLLKEMKPFLWCEVLAAQTRLPVEWRCLMLESQAAASRKSAKPSSCRSIPAPKRNTKNATTRSGPSWRNF